MCNTKDYLINETAWCPGCGNFAIREALAAALAELELPHHQVLLCSGIGQAAKIPHYIKVNGFNGLHGRALPPAIGARVANTSLKVIVESGDGDTYGEGGNHFIHNIRRNPDIAHFVHNNQIYGLTKGQASPTSDTGMKTKVQTAGNILPPFNPLSTALVMGAGFIARCFSGEKDHLKETMKQAIQFPGYALIDILQPCVSFNKLNTYGWYKERVFHPENHDPQNWQAAMELARQWGDEIPLGIFYNVPHDTFESHFPTLRGEPLATRPFNPADLSSLQDEFL
ncbi:thiamine pyrophosphate-dependent enzyme [Dethiobacter alkaliphilus]|uniref:thiamine pyrophosphate-dependent enzyme n=1 Tax=Dethiobacter alkaliphilus TaxID=427926 RepID=UPI0022271563|nr:thiamine pyrophosphate-dependent enzyme [Dethiobacter alkaliphilus]MCW3488634.1 thiamine pyrophosphate-dependent enzyme [Dethiobacter alkaliphilus]